MEIPEERILAAVKPTTIFPMREAHNSPLGKELIEIGKKTCEALELEGVVSGSISAAYGRGFITTSANSDLKDLDPSGIIEILEYDPVRNNIIARGKKEPAMDTPLHWFIYRGFTNVGGIIHIRNNIIEDKFSTPNLKGITITPFKVKYMTPELAMEILKLLKGQNVLLLQDNGMIAVSDSLEKAYDLIVDINKRVAQK